MGRDEYTVEIDDSAAVDNPFVIGEVKRRGKTITFDTREEAKEWVDLMDTYGKKDLELTKISPMDPSKADARLTLHSSDGPDWGL
jgi:hypothetical protein